MVKHDGTQHATLGIPSVPMIKHSFYSNDVILQLKFQIVKNQISQITAVQSHLPTLYLKWCGTGMATCNPKLY